MQPGLIKEVLKNASVTRAPGCYSYRWSWQLSKDKVCPASGGSSTARCYSASIDLGASCDSNGQLQHF